MIICSGPETFAWHFLKTSESHVKLISSRMEVRGQVQQHLHPMREHALLQNNQCPTNCETLMLRIFTSERWSACAATLSKSLTP